VNITGLLFNSLTAAPVVIDLWSTLTTNSDPTYYLKLRGASRDAANFTVKTRGAKTVDSTWTVVVVDRNQVRTRQLDEPKSGKPKTTPEN